MKVELLHVINGYRKFHLGFYDSGQEAVEAMKRDIAINSAIDKPKWNKKYNKANDIVRIDYGLKTCYYLMQAVEVDK